MVECSKNFGFGQIFRKISILVKFSKNFKFGQILEKIRFWSKFPKILILVTIFQNFRFFRNFRKISILVKFSKNFAFCSNFRKKNRFWWKFAKVSKNFDLGQIFETFRFRSKFSKNFDFLEIRNFAKISILVKFSKKFRFWSTFANSYKTVDFCENFQKNSVLVKFSKNFDLSQIFEEFRFFRKSRDISILVKFSKISKNFDFGHDVRQISILVTFSKKIAILVKIFENFDKCRF